MTHLKLQNEKIYIQLMLHLHTSSCDLVIQATWEERGKMHKCAIQTPLLFATAYFPSAESKDLYSILCS